MFDESVLGFFSYLRPFVASWQGQPQANWCHLIGKSDYLSIFLFILFCVLISSHRIQLLFAFQSHTETRFLSALTHDILSERQIIRVWGVEKAGTVLFVCKTVSVAVIPTERVTRRRGVEHTWAMSYVDMKHKLPFKATSCGEEPCSELGSSLCCPLSSLWQQGSIFPP